MIMGGRVFNLTSLDVSRVQPDSPPSHHSDSAHQTQPQTTSNFVLLIESSRKETNRYLTIMLYHDSTFKKQVNFSSSQNDRYSIQRKYIRCKWTVQNLWMIPKHSYSSIQGYFKKKQSTDSSPRLLTHPNQHSRFWEICFLYVSSWQRHTVGKCRFYDCLTFWCVSFKEILWNFQHHGVSFKTSTWTTQKHIGRNVNIHVLVSFGGLNHQQKNQRILWQTPILEVGVGVVVKKKRKLTAFGSQKGMKGLVQMICRISILEGF